MVVTTEGSRRRDARQDCAEVQDQWPTFHGAKCRDLGFSKTSDGPFRRSAWSRRSKDLFKRSYVETKKSGRRENQLRQFIPDTAGFVTLRIPTWAVSSAG